MVRDVQQPVPVQVKPFQDKAGLMRRAPFEPKLRAEPAAPDVPWAPERLAAVVPDPAFDALVDRLSSPRADERAAATAALRAPWLPPAASTTALKACGPSLSPEVSKAQVLPLPTTATRAGSTNSA